MNLDGGVLQFYKQFTKMCFPRINKKKVLMSDKRIGTNRRSFCLWAEKQAQQKKSIFFWDRVDGGGTLEIRDA